MKSSAFFLKTAYRLGIENVFGIVGGESQAIQFDEEENINFYLTRHEFAAGVMAEAYSRITGKPQMCYSTAGPGVTNLLTGVFSAIQERSPVLVVSAQIPTFEIYFNETHQCLDNVGMMKIVTKFAVEIDDVLKIPTILAEALTTAVNGIPGPVFISFPWDLMKTEIEDDIANNMLAKIKRVSKASPPTPDFSKLEYIVDKIKNSKYPIIIAGNQLIREICCREFIEFVNKVNIPVMSTICSKGVIPETHPLYITSANKYIDKVYLQPLTAKTFSECDLVLLVGYDMGEDAKPALWNGIESIVINTFYHDLGKVFQPDYLCLGDMRKSLQYLTEANIQPKKISQSCLDAKCCFDSRKVSDNGEANYLASIMDASRNAVGRNGIVCVDVGLHKLYAALFSKTYYPNTFISSGVCSTFGFGLPAAMGVKLAMPNTRVCVICGDGGFHSTSQDLETVVRYGIPIVIIVLNDNSFGMIKLCQFIARDNIFSRSVDFGTVNFTMLANANGMDAMYITDPIQLEHKMEDAFKKNTSLLIEIPIKYPYKQVAQTSFTEQVAINV